MSNSSAAGSNGAAEPGHGQPRVFVTTHWSVVVSAGQSDSTQARAALEQLCRQYWFPLYVFVRRRGYGPEDAQDLTREFFVRLLEHHWLARADQVKGRFRTFLLTALERFLANRCLHRSRCGATRAKPACSIH